ncbi:MAG TPA: lytic murein transglycosylase [Amaricoccus sp.]|mgnify:CR=1 FL=1|uniref:lytic murein transglycosylase n=1 Tax=Amaricoccus sp. TaxID=1872485 RepID=UPI002BA7167A|nr:lytic murein transglycosylase [Amaricoccus sp.]HMQ95063.1 lytic murein transglycosylase [Amaricoccus sp.]HMR51836.1 lytic murein transglycosylase [Amaricoccus sp.]HMR60262.1 lytic murein transglycosylase [Amaricoccus sp.]HMT99110.1 lytic murein transglycosylase [Amaricoccus sp.]
MARDHRASPPASFVAWRDEFRRYALSQGIRPEVFDAAFRGVTENPEVARLDGSQAEFTKPIWEYLDGAASAARVQTGRARAQEMNRTLAAIESRYGVDSQVVLAVWGMETNYGSNRGSMPVIESLATLAYEGRRRDFAEEQLLAALRILQAGDVSPEAMRGSWAGAMGHTQFMPSSYLGFAVDFTGDGRRDVWGSDPTDALASAANYLARAGWQRGRPWGMEVRLPEGFNYGTADQSNRRPVADWNARGVRRLDGSPLPDHGPAAVITPAGASGPAFVVYGNFFVIKEYNNATSYAMGIGHLGDRIAGGGGFVQSWPRHERELSRTEKIEMQKRLTARGFDPGETDGVVGPDTISAIRAFQSSQGMVPDGFATSALLARLR